MVDGSPKTPHSASRQEQRNMPPAQSFSTTESNRLTSVATDPASASTAATAATVITALAAAFLVGKGLLVALSTPFILVLALCLLAWFFPAGVALTVQLFATKAIQLIGVLAEDEDVRATEEIGLGWEGVRSRVAVEQWDWQHQRRTRRERRVTAEWEAGQLFLVIRRATISEWWINLVNRCIVTSVMWTAALVDYGHCFRWKAQSITIYLAGNF